MLNWLKKASERAQRRNIELALPALIEAATAADRRILESGGAVNPSDVSRVTSIQKSLYGNLIGPVAIADLRRDYLDPVLNNPNLSDGTKLAVRHVFDSFEKNSRR